MNNSKLTTRQWSNIQELKHWLWSSAMQSKRIRESELKIVAHMRSLEPYSQQGQLDFSHDWADLHFFFIAAANLCKCFNLKLTREIKSLELEKLESQKIVKLRNITEHWEQTKKELAGSACRIKSPSIAWYKKNFPNHTAFSKSHDARGFLLCGIFNLDDFDEWSLSLNLLIKSKYSDEATE